MAKKKDFELDEFAKAAHDRFVEKLQQEHGNDGDQAVGITGGEVDVVKAKEHGDDAAGTR